jgi:hypothetical protein
MPARPRPLVRTLTQLDMSGAVHGIVRRFIG